MMTRLQFLALVFTPLVARCIQAHASPRLPSRIQIAANSEPGERLSLSGHALGSDGRPLAGVEIYAYHTGADGLYRRDRFTPEWPSKPPRLQGTLRTAADGSYQIDTIKPAAYPSRNNPAHIHFKLRVSGFPEQGETIWFEGDPLLTAQQKGAYVVRLRRDSDAVLRGTHDFHLGILNEAPTATPVDRADARRRADPIPRTPNLLERPLLNREMGRYERGRRLPRLRRNARLRSCRRGPRAYRRRRAGGKPRHEG